MICIDHLIRYSKFLHELPNMDQFDAYSIEDDNNSLLSLLSNIYEWEYKYNKVLGMSIPERRKDMMLEKIEDKVNPIVSAIVGVLKSTYQDWIEFHNFSSIDDQASKFVTDASVNGTDFLLGTMWNDYTRYCYTNEFNKMQDAIYAISQLPEVAPIAFNCVDAEIYLLEKKDSLSEVDYNNQLIYLESLYNNVEEAIGNYAINYGGIASFIDLIIEEGVNAESIAYVMYHDVILPEFNKFWTDSNNSSKDRNVEDTYNNNNAILNELNNIESQSFRQKMAIS